MRTLRLSALALVIAACSSSTPSDQPAPIAGNTAPPAGAVVGNRYDNARSGWDSHESVLNVSNVAGGQFGLLFTRSTQGWVHAQPLYYPDLTIKGAKHNVVFIVTEHNVVAAYDADDPAAAEPLWSKTLATTFPLSGVKGEYPGCQDILEEAGISSTPVISADTKRIYVVSKTKEMGQRLHALDLSTGDDAPGSPVTIGAPGFDPNIHLTRAGLVTDGGSVYVTFASQCDTGPYHGWVMAYDLQTLKQRSVFNTTPNPPPDMVKEQGGIWQSGAGPTVDKDGMLLVVGNGDSSGMNLGMSVVRLKSMNDVLNVTARFTPDDAVMLNGRDKDFSTAAVPLGDTGQVVVGNKFSQVYLLNQTDLKVLQKVEIPPVPPLMGTNEIHSFGYWNGSAGPLVYVWPDKSPLQAYKVEQGKLTEGAKNTIVSTAGAGGHPGGLFVISSDGAKAGTGILWAVVPMSGDAWHDAAGAKFYAFDASDVSKAPLWSSPDAAEGDRAAEYVAALAKWAPPVVANGKVYLATGGMGGKLMVFGLKK
jgi:hypothetical protein